MDKEYFKSAADAAEIDAILELLEQAKKSGEESTHLTFAIVTALEALTRAVLRLKN